MKHKIKKCAGSEVQHDPRNVGEIQRDILLKSNEPNAVAFRDHMFHDTFLDVEMKLAKRTPGRMPLGASLNGTLVRDDEEHFLFNEKSHDRVVHRVPIILSRQYVNVHLDEHGSKYATLRRPRFSDDTEFVDFLISAADELLSVAWLYIEEKDWA